MAERPVQSTVSPRFSSDVANTDEIILEQSNEWTGQPGFGSIAVREFPVLNGVTRNASIGQILNTGLIRQLNRTEFIDFNGDTGNLRYPLDGSVQSSVIFSFELDGSNLGPSQLSFTFTRGSTDIKSNRPFIGAIRVQYVTSYRVLAYTPDGYTGDVTLGTVGGDDLLRTFGFIISVKDTASAILEIDPSGVLDGSLRKELYRVISITQSNDSGTWERSPDFDSGGGWSDPNSPRDGDTLIEHERPHEIGYLNRIAEGRIEFETVTVFEEQGPPIQSFYRADLLVKFHGQASFDGTAWADSYARIDFGGLQNDIANRFSDHPSIAFE